MASELKPDAGKGINVKVYKTLNEHFADSPYMIGPEPTEPFVVRWWEMYNAMFYLKKPPFEDYCTTTFIKFSDVKIMAWVHLRENVVAIYSTEISAKHRCCLASGGCKPINLFIPNENAVSHNDGVHQVVNFHLM